MKILVTGSTGYVGSNSISTFIGKYDYEKYLKMKKCKKAILIEKS